MVPEGSLASAGCCRWAWADAASEANPELPSENRFQTRPVWNPHTISADSAPFAQHLWSQGSLVFLTCFACIRAPWSPMTWAWSQRPAFLAHTVFIIKCAFPKAHFQMPHSAAYDLTLVGAQHRGWYRVEAHFARSPGLEL